MMHVDQTAALSDALTLVTGNIHLNIIMVKWPSSPDLLVTCSSPSDQIQQKLEANNVFLIARRQVDVGGVNQELMYMSLKFINNIWVLAEVKAAPGGTSVGVSGVCFVFVLSMV